jgi:hypothetical protein
MILGYEDPPHATLSYVGVVAVGPQRVLGCELYRDEVGFTYAVGFADHVARSVFRVRVSRAEASVELLDVIYDANVIADVVAAFRIMAGGGGGLPEVRRRALVELAGALGGPLELADELIMVVRAEREGA